jgi:AcrR family transcriptional regulator
MYPMVTSDVSGVNTRPDDFLRWGLQRAKLRRGRKARRVTMRDDERAARARRKGRRGRRERADGYHHGDLKRSLVEEALAVIAETRHPSFTLRDLAKRVGVSHAAAYRHFASKEALLAAVAEEGFRLLHADLSATQERDRGPLDVLLAKGMAYAQFAADRPAHFRVMFGPEPADKSGFPSLLEITRETYRSLLSSVVACQAAGHLEDADPELISVVAWSAVHGVSALLVDGLLPGPARFETLAPGEIAAAVCMSALRGFVRIPR